MSDNFATEADNADLRELAQSIIDQAHIVGDLMPRQCHEALMKASSSLVKLNRLPSSPTTKMGQLQKARHERRIRDAYVKFMRYISVSGR